MTSIHDKEDVIKTQTRTENRGKALVLDICKRLDVGECGAPVEVWKELRTFCGVTPSSRAALRLLRRFYDRTTRIILKDEQEWLSPGNERIRNDLIKVLRAHRLRGSATGSSAIGESRTESRSRTSLRISRTKEETPQTCTRTDRAYTCTVLDPLWEREAEERSRALADLAGDPWGHPVLQALLDKKAQQPTQDQILQWLLLERWSSLSHRLHKLCFLKRDALALRLVSAAIASSLDPLPSASAASEDSPRDLWTQICNEDSNTECQNDNLTSMGGFDHQSRLFINDLRLVLLQRLQEPQKCVRLLKEVPLDTALSLVERLSSRGSQTGSTEKRLWKHSRAVALLAAQVSITRCMNYEDDASISLAGELSTRLASLYGDTTKLKDELSQLLGPASTNKHINACCEALNQYYQLSADVSREESQSRKILLCDMYTKSLNWILADLVKMRDDKGPDAEESKVLAETTARWLVNFSGILGTSTLRRECVLTAFSLNPNRELYDLVSKEAVIMTEKSRNCDSDTVSSRTGKALEEFSAKCTLDEKMDQSPAVPGDFRSWQGDSKLDKFNGLVITTLENEKRGHKLEVDVLADDILDSALFGLTPDQQSDLTTLLCHPRNKTLSWTLGWERLQRLCAQHMDGSGQVPITQLNFVHLDYAKYEDYVDSEDDEDRKDPCYGYQKGYLNLSYESDETNDRSDRDDSDYDCKMSTHRAASKTKKLETVKEDGYWQSNVGNVKKNQIPKPQNGNEPPFISVYRKDMELFEKMKSQVELSIPPSISKTTIDFESEIFGHGIVLNNDDGNMLTSSDISVPAAVKEVVVQETIDHESKTNGTPLLFDGLRVYPQQGPAATQTPKVYASTSKAKTVQPKQRKPEKTPQQPNLQKVQSRTEQPQQHHLHSGLKAVKTENQQQEVAVRVDATFRPEVHIYSRKATDSTLGISAPQPQQRVQTTVFAETPQMQHQHCQTHLQQLLTQADSARPQQPQTQRSSIAALGVDTTQPQMQKDSDVTLLFNTTQPQTHKVSDVRSDTTQPQTQKDSDVTLRFNTTQPQTPKVTLASFKTKAPRKPRDPKAPPRVRKPRDPNAPPRVRKPKDPNAPPRVRKPKDPNAPPRVRKPKDPNAPPRVRKPRDPNAPPIVRKPRDPIAPQRTQKPEVQKPKNPNAPPVQQLKIPNVKKPKDPNALPRVQKPNVPNVPPCIKKPIDPNATCVQKPKHQNLPTSDQVPKGAIALPRMATTMDLNMPFKHPNAPPIVQNPGVPSVQTPVIKYPNAPPIVTKARDSNAPSVARMPKGPNSPPKRIGRPPKKDPRTPARARIPKDPNAAARVRKPKDPNEPARPKAPRKSAGPKQKPADSFPYFSIDALLENAPTQTDDSLPDVIKELMENAIKEHGQSDSNSEFLNAMPLDRPYNISSGEIRKFIKKPLPVVSERATPFYPNLSSVSDALETFTKSSIQASGQSGPQVTREVVRVITPDEKMATMLGLPSCQYSDWLRQIKKSTEVTEPKSDLIQSALKTQTMQVLGQTLISRIQNHAAAAAPAKPSAAQTNLVQPIHSGAARIVQLKKSVLKEPPRPKPASSVIKENLNRKIAERIGTFEVPIAGEIVTPNVPQYNNINTRNVTKAFNSLTAPVSKTPMLQISPLVRKQTVPNSMQRIPEQKPRKMSKQAEAKRLDLLKQKSASADAALSPVGSEGLDEFLDKDLIDEIDELLSDEDQLESKKPDKKAPSGTGESNAMLKKLLLNSGPLVDDFESMIKSSIIPAENTYSNTNKPAASGKISTTNELSELLKRAPSIGDHSEINTLASPKKKPRLSLEEPLNLTFFQGARDAKVLPKPENVQPRICVIPAPITNQLKQQDPNMSQHLQKLKEQNALTVNSLDSKTPKPQDSQQIGSHITQKILQQVESQLRPQVLFTKIRRSETKPEPQKQVLKQRNSRARPQKLKKVEAVVSQQATPQISSQVQFKLSQLVEIAISNENSLLSPQQVGHPKAIETAVIQQNRPQIAQQVRPQTVPKAGPLETPVLRQVWPHISQQVRPQTLPKVEPQQQHTHALEMPVSQQNQPSITQQIRTPFSQVGTYQQFTQAVEIPLLQKIRPQIRPLEMPVLRQVSPHVSQQVRPQSLLKLSPQPQHTQVVLTAVSQQIRPPQLSQQIRPQVSPKVGPIPQQTQAVETVVSQQIRAQISQQVRPQVSPQVGPQQQRTTVSQQIGPQILQQFTPQNKVAPQQQQTSVSQQIRPQISQQIKPQLSPKVGPQQQRTVVSQQIQPQISQQGIPQTKTVPQQKQAAVSQQIRPQEPQQVKPQVSPKVGPQQQRTIVSQQIQPQISQQGTTQTKTVPQQKQAAVSQQIRPQVPQQVKPRVSPKVGPQQQRTVVSQQIQPQISQQGTPHAKTVPQQKQAAVSQQIRPQVPQQVKPQVSPKVGPQRQHTQALETAARQQIRPPVSQYTQQIVDSLVTSKAIPPQQQSHVYIQQVRPQVSPKVEPQDSQKVEHVVSENNAQFSHILQKLGPNISVKSPTSRCGSPMPSAVTQRGRKPRAKPVPKAEIPSLINEESKVTEVPVPDPSPKTKSTKQVPPRINEEINTPEVPVPDPKTIAIKQRKQRIEEKIKELKKQESERVCLPIIPLTWRLSKQERQNLIRKKLEWKELEESARKKLPVIALYWVVPGPFVVEQTMKDLSTKFSAVKQFVSSKKYRKPALKLAMASVTPTITPSVTPSLTPSATPSVTPSVSPSVSRSVTPQSTPPPKTPAQNPIVTITNLKNIAQKHSAVDKFVTSKMYRKTHDRAAKKPSPKLDVIDLITDSEDEDSDDEVLFVSTTYVEPSDPLDTTLCRYASDVQPCRVVVDRINLERLRDDLNKKVRERKEQLKQMQRCQVVLDRVDFGTIKVEVDDDSAIYNNFIDTYEIKVEENESNSVEEIIEVPSPKEITDIKTEETVNPETPEDEADSFDSNKKLPHFEETVKQVDKSKSSDHYSLIHHTESVSDKNTTSEVLLEIKKGKNDILINTTENNEYDQNDTKRKSKKADDPVDQAISNSHIVLPETDGNELNIQGMDTSLNSLQFLDVSIENIAENEIINDESETQINGNDKVTNVQEIDRPEAAQNIHETDSSLNSPQILDVSIENIAENEILTHETETPINGEDKVTNVQEIDHPEVAQNIQETNNSLNSPRILDAKIENITVNEILTDEIETPINGDDKIMKVQEVDYTEVAQNVQETKNSLNSPRILDVSIENIVKKEILKDETDTSINGDDKVRTVHEIDHLEPAKDEESYSFEILDTGSENVIENIVAKKIFEDDTATKINDNAGDDLKGIIQAIDSPEVTLYQNTDTGSNKAIEKTVKNDFHLEVKEWNAILAEKEDTEPKIQETDDPTPQLEQISVTVTDRCENNDSYPRIEKSDTFLHEKEDTGPKVQETDIPAPQLNQNSVDLSPISDFASDDTIEGMIVSDIINEDTELKISEIDDAELEIEKTDSREESTKTDDTEVFVIVVHDVKPENLVKDNSECAKETNNQTENDNVPSKCDDFASRTEEELESCHIGSIEPETNDAIIDLKIDVTGTCGTLLNNVNSLSSLALDVVNKMEFPEDFDDDGSSSDILSTLQAGDKLFYGGAEVTVFGIYQMESSPASTECDPDDLPKLDLKRKSTETEPEDVHSFKRICTDDSDSETLSGGLYSPIFLESPTDEEETETDEGFSERSGGDYGSAAARLPDVNLSKLLQYSAEDRENDLNSENILARTRAFFRKSQAPAGYRDFRARQLLSRVPGMSGIDFFVPPRNSYTVRVVQVGQPPAPVSHQNTVNCLPTETNSAPSSERNGPSGPSAAAPAPDPEPPAPPVAGPPDPDRRIDVPSAAENTPPVAARPGFQEGGSVQSAASASGPSLNAQALVSLLAQKLPRAGDRGPALSLQQALAQLLSPQLAHAPDSRLLHIVKQPDPHSHPPQTNTQLLHILNKNCSAQGNPSYEAGSQATANQVLHILNAGTQTKANATAQLLKRVNLLTSLQGANEQKMVQFVCKSTDGKTIQLNSQHPRGMVLRLQPIETTAPKPTDDKTETTVNAPTVVAPTVAAPAPELKSRSVYEENYAKFIQGPSRPVTPEKATSLPKFNQAFGKSAFQDENSTEKEEEEVVENSAVEEPILENMDSGAMSGHTLLVRKSQTTVAHQTTIARQTTISHQTTVAHQTTIAHQTLIQQLKQSMAPMNIQSVHGGVIYTRQIPVNIGGGQTINLITVPSHEALEEGKAQAEGRERLVRLVPQEAAAGPDGDGPGQPVLAQMRIKLPMLSKGPQAAGASEGVRPVLQIQRGGPAGAGAAGGAGAAFRRLVLAPAPRAPFRRPEPPISSSTLEQLREFDLVLERVKGRSAQSPTAPAPPPAPPPQQPPPPRQLLCSIGDDRTLNVAYLDRKIVTAAAFGSTSSSAASTTPQTSPQILSQSVPSSPVSNQPKSAPSTPKISSKSIKKSSKPAIAANNTSKSTPVASKTAIQKPLEDEQTTQRILYILAEYKEQVENSPDKDKPAPRRRSNPPTNPSTSSKRKKSGGSKKGSGQSHRDASPIGAGDDPGRTMGSEDSSCGFSQGECSDLGASGADNQSPQGSPSKAVRKLAFPPHEAPPAAAPAGAKGAAVLVPGNYLLPVSMVKSGHQIAIVTGQGPKLLGLPQGEGANALFLQRLVGPGAKRPGQVRHLRLPGGLSGAAAHDTIAWINSHPKTTDSAPDSVVSESSDAPSLKGEDAADGADFAEEYGAANAASDEGIFSNATTPRSDHQTTVSRSPSSGTTLNLIQVQSADGTQQKLFQVQNPSALGSLLQLQNACLNRDGIRDGADATRNVMFVRKPTNFEGQFNLEPDKIQTVIESGQGMKLLPGLVARCAPGAIITMHRAPQPAMEEPSGPQHEKMVNKDISDGNTPWRFISTTGETVNIVSSGGPVEPIAESPSQTVAPYSTFADSPTSSERAGHVIREQYSPEPTTQQLFDKMFVSCDSKKTYADEVSSEASRTYTAEEKTHQLSNVEPKRLSVSPPPTHQPSTGFTIHHHNSGSSATISHGHLVGSKSVAAQHAHTLRHKYALIEQELRLQKSLSEECEDLGVDSPSASELFPEAELLFAPSSPATSLPLPALSEHQQSQGSPQSIVQTHMSAVGEIRHEEFARSHPNTTFSTHPALEVQGFGSNVPIHVSSKIQPQHSDLERLMSSINSEDENSQPSKVALNRFEHMLGEPDDLTAPRNVARVIRRAEKHGHNGSGAYDPSAGAILKSIVESNHCSSPEPHGELFWDSNSNSNQSDGRLRGVGADFSSEGSDKCCKSPSRSYDETLSTDSSAESREPVRLNSVIKSSVASGTPILRSALGGGSPDAEAECAPHLRTYGARRTRAPSASPRSLSDELNPCTEIETSSSEDKSVLKSGLLVHHRLESDSSAPDSPPTARLREEEGSSGPGRRASLRGVVKRGCHCCNGSPSPQKPKKPRFRFDSTGRNRKSPDAKRARSPNSIVSS